MAVSYIKSARGRRLAFIIGEHVNSPRSLFRAVFFAFLAQGKYLSLTKFEQIDNLTAKQKIRG